MAIRTRAAFVPVLLALVVAAPQAASAKGSPIRSVSSATHVTPGEPLSVEIRVKGPATIALYLSANSARDKNDVKLAGGAKVRGRGKRVVSADPTVPSGQPLGTYHVIACAKTKCVAAKPTVDVTATPVGSKQLVDAALAANKLTPQQALYYRALAAFGDPRVPADYVGDGSEVEHGVVRQLIEQWPTLSPAQQAALNPYFSPPPARGARRARASAGSAQPTCDTEQVKKYDWRTLALPNGHVRIWWQVADEDKIGPRARSFLLEIENHMWPRLVGLLGREPMSDGGQRCYHGVDGKLDLYMWGLDRRLDAMTFAYPPKCTGTPAFIVFNAHKQLPTNWAVAHELFHAFQFSYRYKGACSSYSNWDEAAATWAADYLYPKDDYEHHFSDYAAFTHLPFANIDYAGWIFPYAMTQLHGAGTMKAIYDQTEVQPGPLQAIDAGIPGGFKQSWPEFAMAGWNQDPVETSFRQWDRFDRAPADDPWPTGQPIKRWHIGNGDAGQTEVDVQIPDRPLTRVYRALKFDPDVSMVMGFTPYNPNLHVDALIKLADGTMKTEDWSKRRMAIMCPESPSQRVEELTVIASNTSMDATIPKDPPIKVVASNIGCSRYTGTVTGVEHVHTQSINTTETWTAHDLVFKRAPSGEDNPVLIFDLVAGSVTWSISGTNGSCSISAGPVELPIKPDGSMGSIDISTWLYDHPERPYSALGWNLPQVDGTGKCSNGTNTWHFKPQTFLLTEDYGMNKGPVPADGVLQGSWSGDEHSGGWRDVTYSWHFVPEN